LSLLIVLAMVGWVATKQMQAGSGGLMTRSADAASQALSATTEPGNPGQAAPATAGGAASDAGGLTIPEQSRRIQEQIRDSAARALQQEEERNDRAER
jgi:hypothetical protein